MRKVKERLGPDTMTYQDVGFIRRPKCAA
jgi:hypothetical protein